MRRLSLAILAALGATPVIAADPQVLDGAAAFPEGPVFHDGALIYAVYGGISVSRIDPETGAMSEIWRKDGCGPSAVLPLGERFLVTCYESGTLVAFDGEGNTTDTWAADADGDLLSGPNDAAPDGKGGAYVTASGPWESGPIVGRVLHLDEAGGLRTVADDLHYANGIALSPAGDRLFVAESEAGRIISFAVAEDGSLSDRRLFVRLGAIDPASGVLPYPDGIEFGPDGALWIGQLSSGRILAVDPFGELVTAIDLPAPAAPNLAFTPDGAGLVVVTVDDPANPPYPGKVYRLELP
jgi:sugar lactone lactonase YvrE